jgi:hypothetical protein
MGGCRVGREFRLGQRLYFVLWDEATEEAGLACGEVVQYASDHSKVRLRVVEAPQRQVVGRSTWVLPDRVDDDPRSARIAYQRRARAEMREAEGEAEHAPAKGAETVSDATPAAWQAVAEGWHDVQVLVDSVDFEAGWPSHQARLAKFAVFAVLRLRPHLEALLAEAAGDEAAEAVQTALEGGALGSAAAFANADPAAVLERWDEVPEPDVASTADQISGLRAALIELASARGWSPSLPEQ